MTQRTVNAPQFELSVYPRWISRGSLYLLVGAATSAWIGSLALAMLQLLGALQPTWVWSIAISVGAGALLVSWRLRPMLVGIVDSRASDWSRFDERIWAITWFVIGIVLRLSWVLAFPHQPISDGAAYVGLAQRLLTGQSYTAGGTFAYWPPGYPLFMVPWLAVMPSVAMAVISSNLFLFGLGLVGVRKLALTLAGLPAARFAVLLFAVWPNHVIYSSIPGKELVLVSLMPWVLWLALRGDDGRLWRPVWQVACGAVLGAATLVQPALQLFPLVLALYWMFATRKFWRTSLGVAAVLIGMAAVVAPWTVRNYHVFGQFVLVSTNGGFGLYGANNPRANGSYYEYWSEEPVMQMEELAADREAKRLAVNWIKDYPLDFLVLAAKKNALFMGDDAAGAYINLKFARAALPSWLYPSVKGISNAWWLAYWTLVMVMSLTLISRAVFLTSNVVLLTSTFAYSFLMHTIVESSGRYHILQLGILCVLLPLLGSAIHRNHFPSNEAPRSGAWIRQRILTT